MVFAAPSAMWLYCTGTMFGGRVRLLTTLKESKREVEEASRESEKHREKNEVHSLERKEKQKEAKKDE